jgi:hypothetical protein
MDILMHTHMLGLPLTRPAMPIRGRREGPEPCRRGTFRQEMLRRERLHQRKRRFSWRRWARLPNDGVAGH